MSVSLVLLPLAIAFGASIGTTTLTAAAATAAAVGSKAILAVAAEAHGRHIRHLRELYEKSQRKALPPIETIFNDSTILEKTLKEHGLSVSAISDNQIVCKIGETQLNYFRQTDGEPFKMTVSGLRSIDEFLDELECFEREYKQNVQSYTYHTLMENINRSSMSVAEETILDDNSILLTIDI